MILTLFEGTADRTAVGSKLGSNEGLSVGPDEGKELGIALGTSDGYMKIGINYKIHNIYRQMRKA